MNSETTDMIRAGASNWADWHGSQLAAHGLRCTRSESLWRCWEPGGVIYLGAITLAPSESGGLYSEIEELAESRKHGGLILADCWMTLDLSHLGFEAANIEPWYIRPAIPLPQVTPSDELRIEQVSTLSALREFDAASLKGFEVPDSEKFSPFEIHAESSIEDPKLNCYIGRVGGDIACISMAYVSNGVAGVYGVATLPKYRRRGYAEAMTWAAIQSGLGLPVVLQPTPMAESMYQRMGFEEVGRLQMWRRAGS